MPLLESCCCCSLLTGAILAGLYTAVVYLLAFCLTFWWLLEDTMYRGDHGGATTGRLPGQVLCSGHALLMLASLAMLYGLYKRLQRVVACWILLMVVVFFPEMGLVLFVNLYHRTVATPAGMLNLAFYTARASLNMVCIVCVQSLYTSWRGIGKTAGNPGHVVNQLSRLEHNNKDAFEVHSINGRGNMYDPHSPQSYPPNIYYPPPYNYGQDNGYQRTDGGYQHNGYVHTDNSKLGHADKKLLHEAYNEGFAASNELVPSKVAVMASNGDHKGASLSRSPSRLSHRALPPSYLAPHHTSHGRGQPGMMPAQFNAALYASTTSLAGPYALSSYLSQSDLIMQHQLLSRYPSPALQAAYLQQMVQLTSGDYATQSLDRRKYRREEDCDALSLRGVGLRRDSRRGFILGGRGRGRGGSFTSLGAESDEMRQYRDVAL